MDVFGARKKINGHVYKALDHYMHRGNGSTFLQIFHFVKNLNRNSKRISNLWGVVRSVLEHFQRIGVIHKDECNYYRLRCPTLFTEMVKMESQPKPENDPCPGIKSKIHPSVPTKPKKKRRFDDSYRSENRVGITRRFLGIKKGVESRKRKKVNTPRAKRHRSANRQAARSRDSEGPRIVSAEKVESHRKMQEQLNFDGGSTGEPGADDRDSGDNSYVRSMTSLDRIDASGQLPNAANNSVASIAQNAMDGSLSSLNHANEQDEVSKVDVIKFE